MAGVAVIGILSLALVACAPGPAASPTVPIGSRPTSLPTITPVPERDFSLQAPAPTATASPEDFRVKIGEGDDILQALIKIKGQTNKDNSNPASAIYAPRPIKPSVVISRAGECTVFPYEFALYGKYARDIVVSEKDKQYLGSNGYITVFPEDIVGEYPPDVASKVCPEPANK